MSVVVDASVVVELLTGTDLRLFEREDLRAGWAPHLLDAEVGHALRRRAAGGSLSAPQAQRAIDRLSRLPIRRAPHTALLARAWELRENVTFYGALYVALAERLDAPLLTLDERLAAAPGPRCVIEVP